MNTRDEFRQWFFEYRRLGYSPIPVDPITRKPCIAGWQVYCTRQATDKEIKDWLRKFPKSNIALCGGYGGFVAVDVDDSFMLATLAQVLTAETTGKFGSKGVTAFYRSDDVKSRAMGVDGRACIEFLGTGRNTTVPPSIHHTTGQPYRWLSPLRPAWELPQLPDGTAEACYGALVTVYGHGCYGNPTPPVLAPSEGRAGAPGGRMKAWADAALVGEVERVAETPKGGRANRLFRSACAVGKYVVHGVLNEAEVIDALLSAAETNELLAEEGAASCVAQIRSGISKAAADTLPDIGQPTFEEMFGARSIVAYAPAATPVSGFPIAAPPAVRVIRPGEIPTRIEPGLVHRLYPLSAPGGYSFLFGQPGAKKTWFALYRAICIAAGIDLFGYRTQQRFTSYYAAENVESIHLRAHCICEHLKIRYEDLQFIIIPYIGDLRERTNAEALVSTIKSFGRCYLLEIDTITEAFAIQDENAPREWLDVQHACRLIGREIGGCVDAIHHTGKDASRGGRGSSAIGGSHDFSITATVQEDGSTCIGHGPGDKMRDVCDRSFPNVAFRIVGHTLDETPDIFGDPWTSGYPVACNVANQRNTRDQALYDAFVSVIGKIIPVNDVDLGRRNGKPLNDVREQFMIRYDANANAKRQAWFKLVSKMRDGDHDEFRVINEIIVTIEPDAAMAFSVT